MSRTLKEIPGAGFGYLFIDPKHRDEAKPWLQQIREKMFGVQKGSDS